MLKALSKIGGGVNKMLEGPDSPPVDAPLEMCHGDSVMVMTMMMTMTTMTMRQHLAGFSGDRSEMCNGDSVMFTKS